MFAGSAGERARADVTRGQFVGPRRGAYHPPVVEGAGHEAEVAALRAQVVELSAALELQALRTRRILGAAGEGFHMIGMDGRIVDCNDAFARMLGYTREELMTMRISQVDPTPSPDLSALTRRLVDTGGHRFVTRHRRRDGDLLDVEVTVHHVELGGESFFAGFSHSIGEQLARERALREAEAERAALQAQVIAAQEATIRELEAPVIPLGDGVLVVPIIGRLDRARAEGLRMRVLEEVTSRRARALLLDVTGVAGVDAEAADGLLQVTGAVRLLGAAAIVTGVRPGVAAALVELGADLTGLVTHATLQRGLQAALRLAR